MIAFDAVAQGDTGGNATSLTVPLTVGSISNGYLVVFVQGGDTTDLVTGVTYNGVAMTRLHTYNASCSRRTYMYGLANPASGAHNIVASFGASQFFALVGASYSGVDGTGQPDSTGQNTAAPGTSVTVTNTIVKANSWLVMGLRQDTGADVAGGTGGTLRSTTAKNYGLADSNGAKAAGSQTIQMTTTSSSNLDGLAVSLSPFIPSSGGLLLDFGM